jgi:hypothetical protein
MENDLVNHPPHYKQGRFETIDIIEDIAHSYMAAVPAYLVGNVVKYIARAPHKGAYLQDLKKAQWYLARLIERTDDALQKP